MKIIVQYSGGKDSQASLIRAVKLYGSKNITAVFADTNWEHEVTYKHLKTTTTDLGVELVVLKSKKYNGLIDLSLKKKRFPSTKARFCTQELKVKPFIDYILDEVKDHVIVIQGIRADESVARSRMNQQCRLFKFYTEPFGTDRKGKKKYHTYRKKEVLNFISNYADDIIRPVFKWSGQRVIDYIIENDQKPNPLYKEGFKRVGCFPCVMSNLSSVKQLVNRYPERIQEIRSYEKMTKSSFFPPDKIPKYARTNGIYPTIIDVKNYVDGKSSTIDLFETDKTSCMSFYSLCE
ncbi:phosphoadenosine phosphosulfate reductase family protein [Aquimarina algiphila]|uniref:phosphoadenosine phosphosulfate reductase family protein n=1 Tax=Aquimarina algiphila TaxID=2047982 RepID=UPI002492A86F|nr:phosphoadenosine phosphosulfate reductase family protein [Aquimarina algiphila]